MVLAVILSFRRITRSQNPMTESGLGMDGRTAIVGMNGTGAMETTESGKIVVEIVKAGTTTTRITTMADRVKIAKAGTITTKTVTRTTTKIVVGTITKKMTVQDGEIGVIKTIKTTSGMVGRAGVADVDCQSALANPVSGFGKKQLSAGEELSALVPVSDRSSFEFEGLVEECPTLVRVVDGQGSTSRGFVWGALCFAAAVLSSTRVVVLRGLRCLWCLSAAVRNRLAHSLNGNQEGLYPWILCGIISLATYRVGEEFADGATAVVRVTTEMIEDVFETTSIEVQETIQWVGMFARAALVVVVWYVGRTCWSKLMHVLHGNTTTKGPTDVEAWRFLLNEPASTRPIGLCFRVAVEGAERIYQVEGSSGASYRSVLHDTDKSIRSGAVARRMFSQESPASIWLR